MKFRHSISASVARCAANAIIASGIVVSAHAEECTPQAFPFPLSPAALSAAANFGSAVDVDGDRAVVGAPGQASVGAVYLHELKNGDWTGGQVVSPVTLAPGDGFGTAVALSGDWLLVGAPGDDTKGVDAGAVYVFKRAWVFADNYVWGFIAKFHGTDTVAGDGFGTAVDLDYPVAIVGAPLFDDFFTDDGSAYAFEDAGGWIQTEVLRLPSDAGEKLGYSVSVRGSIAVVGAPFHDGLAAEDTGRAIVYQRSTAGGVNWNLASILDPVLDKFSSRYFGASVEYTGSRLLVGAPGVSGQNGVAKAGAGYVYSALGSPSLWSSPIRLQPANPLLYGLLGSDVAFAGNVALVAGNAGVHRFEVVGASTWISKGKLIAPYDPLPATGALSIGKVIAASGSNAMVGTPKQEDYEFDKVYPFHLCGGTWTTIDGGAPGSHGTPRLDWAGPLLSGFALQMRLYYGPSNAPGIFFVRIGEPTNVAFAGGVLAAFPPHATLPIMLDSNGKLSLPAVLPPGLEGNTIVVQFALADPVAAADVSLTDGLVLAIGG